MLANLFVKKELRNTVPPVAPRKPQQRHLGIPRASDDMPHRRWPARSQSFDLGAFRLRIFGDVERPLDLDWEALGAQPRTEVITSISAPGTSSHLRAWIGADLRFLLRTANPLPGADWLLIHCEGGYSHRVAIDRVLEAPSVLADRVDRRPLSRSEGGPLRLVLPDAEGWRCAKWVRGLEIETWASAS